MGRTERAESQGRERSKAENTHKGQGLPLPVWVMELDATISHGAWLVDKDGQE